MSTRIAETFAVLGDPVRNAIVDRLVSSDANLGELAGLFTITVQAVSQQISTLERAGLVTRHREGRTRRVHLELDLIQEASSWLEIRRLHLEQRYQRLDGVLAEVLAAEQPPKDHFQG
ncbi:MAG: ArsR/SmtB family transcription factor [Nakamurella sp.]